MENLREVKHLLVTVFLSSFAMMIVVPAITDVTIFALCPDSSQQYQCSLAIYLFGFQQAIIGIGTVVMMPLIGNLSDRYGRKALLTLPLTISPIPLVILAYSRTTKFFYAYYVLRILTAMVSEGSISCLALAYVADTIPVGQRTSAFGIVSGITSTSFVCATLAARFLSTALTFQVSAFVSILAVAYMRIFLKESLHFPDGEKDLTHPILKARSQDGNQVDGDDVHREAPVFRKIPTPGDLISLLKNSPTLSQAAVVAFFCTLSFSGSHACIQFYLKARFNFSKDQYAVLMLLISIAGMIAQLILMPLLARFMSEEKLLSIGLLVTFIQSLLQSIAWSAWVTYAVTVCYLFATFVHPCLHSIASKQVGPYEQGKAQGCISGISSIANILSPLIFSPLTALFLSEQAPFNFPGFSILCIGLAALIAFFQSLMIRPVPPPSSQKIITNAVEA